MGETSYLLEHIEFKPNDIVFDIGANLGDLTLYFDLKKIPIRYYGFEPGKYEFICLKKNVINYQNHKMRSSDNTKQSYDYFERKANQPTLPTSKNLHL